MRRTEHRELQGEGEETLTGSKFLFLFAPENLDIERRARLRDLLNRDLKVGRAWTLKEQFRHFWERANARTALSFFEEWYARAVRSRLKPMIAADEILWRHRSISLTIIITGLPMRPPKALTHVSKPSRPMRGFRSFHNFRTRILFFLGKLDLSPA